MTRRHGAPPPCLPATARPVAAHELPAIPMPRDPRAPPQHHVTLQAAASPRPVYILGGFARRLF